VLYNAFLTNGYLTMQFPKQTQYITLSSSVGTSMFPLGSSTTATMTYTAVTIYKSFYFFIVWFCNCNHYYCSICDIFFGFNCRYSKYWYNDSCISLRWYINVHNNISIESPFNAAFYGFNILYRGLFI
jgi:hypothetical protein